ncbi:MAG: hypothetical protein L0I76_26145 [Pseudonocardia sp.]|nr:hypothetical protein [Pseudonocardia sp.]
MTRLRTTAPLLVAAGLAALAVVTVRTAGCNEPAHYEFLPGGGSVLIGGCIEPGDVIVPPAPVPPVPEAPVPSRS